MFAFTSVHWQTLRLATSQLVHRSTTLSAYAEIPFRTKKSGLRARHVLKKNNKCICVFTVVISELNMSGLPWNQRLACHRLLFGESDMEFYVHDAFAFEVSFDMQRSCC